MDAESNTIVFVLGAPGSGKGTQCARIKEEYGFLHMSTGDLLRAEVEEGTEIGQRVEGLMQAGEMVPTDLVLDLLVTAMDDSGMTRFLVDGYPRTLEQLQAFEEKIQPADHVLVLTVPEDVAIQRLLQRGAESGRADDNEETIRNRLQVFQEESVPVIEHLKASGRVQEVEASADEDTVFAAVAPLMDMLQERASAKEEAVATAESGGDPLVITQTQTGLGEIQPPVAEEEEEDGAQEGEAGVEEEQQPQQQEEGNGEGGEQQQQGEEGNEEEQQLEGGEYEQVGMGDDGDGDGVVQAAEQEGDQGLGDGEGETTEEGGITGLEKVKANRRRQELLKEPGLREGPSGEAEEVHTGGAEAGGEAQGGATEAAGDARSDREQEYGEAEGGAVDNIQTGDEEAGAEGGGGDEEVEGEVQAGGEGAVDEAEGEAARGDGEAGDVLGADATAAAAAAAAGELHVEGEEGEEHAEGAEEKEEQLEEDAGAADQADDAAAAGAAGQPGEQQQELQQTEQDAGAAEEQQQEVQGPEAGDGEGEAMQQLEQEVKEAEEPQMLGDGEQDPHGLEGESGQTEQEGQQLAGEGQEEQAELEGDHAGRAQPDSHWGGGGEEGSEVGEARQAEEEEGEEEEGEEEDARQQQGGWGAEGKQCPALVPCYMLASQEAEGRQTECGGSLPFPMPLTKPVTPQIHLDLQAGEDGSVHAQLEPINKQQQSGQDSESFAQPHSERDHALQAQEQQPLSSSSPPFPIPQNKPVTPQIHLDLQAGEDGSLHAQLEPLNKQQQSGQASEAPMQSLSSSPPFPIPQNKPVTPQIHLDLQAGEDGSLHAQLEPINKQHQSGQALEAPTQPLSGSSPPFPIPQNKPVPPQIHLDLQAGEDGSLHAQLEPLNKQRQSGQASEAPMQSLSSSPPFPIPQNKPVTPQIHLDLQAGEDGSLHAQLEPLNKQQHHHQSNSRPISARNSMTDQAAQHPIAPTPPAAPAPELPRPPSGRLSVSPPALNRSSLAASRATAAAEAKAQAPGANPLAHLPVRQYMDAAVVPTLREGLRALNKERPPDPLLFLSDFLLKARAGADSGDVGSG